MVPILILAQWENFPTGRMATEFETGKIGEWEGILRWEFRRKPPRSRPIPIQSVAFIPLLDTVLVSLLF